MRQVLLPEIVSRALLSLRGEAGANDAVFRSREGGGHLTERSVNGMVKRAAAKAASARRSRPTGSDMPTARTPSIVVHRCQRFRPP